MDASLYFDPAMAAYDLGPDHPLKPERFTLAVALMEAYELLAPPAEPGPRKLAARAVAPATDDEIEAVHDPAYVAAVKAASADPRRADTRWGIATLDTPAFRGMHEASALIAGATLSAARDVAAGRERRAFSVAGGLHHAHRDRAAGFCVYNDCAIAIAALLRADPEARVVYVDVDAHHGDGVQEAFWDEPRCVTISLHERGDRLYPGTGWPAERGGPGAEGSAYNVPLPEFATDECYEEAFTTVVEPVVRAARPTLLFAQCGADAHHDDPLTTLGLTVGGHALLVDRIVRLADESCDGRLVACGGGGYGWEHVVPRCWTLLAARLAGVRLPDALPAAWRERAAALAGVEPPRSLREDAFEVGARVRERLLSETSAVCAETMAGRGASGA